MIIIMKIQFVLRILSKRRCTTVSYVMIEIKTLNWITKLNHSSKMPAVCNLNSNVSSFFLLFFCVSASLPISSERASRNGPANGNALSPSFVCTAGFSRSMMTYRFNADSCNNVLHVTVTFSHMNEVHDETRFVINKRLCILFSPHNHNHKNTICTAPTTAWTVVHYSIEIKLKLKT